MTDLKFNDTTHTEGSLQGMEDAQLLTLRNQVAAALGVAEIKGFKDHETAVAQTLKALERHAAHDPGEVKSEEKAAKKTKKPPKDKKPRTPAKSSEPHTIKRPNRKMFATIAKTGKHDGSHGRELRWPHYKDGMTIADVIEGDGTEPWDVYNWEKQGIMKVTPATDDEYKARRAQWYKAKGLEDPEATKERKKEEREAATKKRAEEKAVKDAAKAKADKAKT